MKFYDQRHINKIQIPIVRICNRKCPHCCARDQLTWYNRKLNKNNEVSIEELRDAANKIGQIEQIEITGGEPTLHSQFEEISVNLMSIFNCEDTMLVSNGYLFGRDPSQLHLLLNYKRIWITHYTENFVGRYGKSGAPNTETVNLIKRYLERVHHPYVNIITMDDHIPFGEAPYGGNPCDHYYSNMISYYEGKLFGCCVSWSLPHQGTGVPLTSNWRNELHKIELPCEQCFLSKETAPVTISPR